MYMPAVKPVVVLTFIVEPELVAPAAETYSAGPVAHEKFVYGGVGTGPTLVVIPSGVESKSGYPKGILSSLPGVFCFNIAISAYLIDRG